MWNRGAGDADNKTPAIADSNPRANGYPTADGHASTYSHAHHHGYGHTDGDLRDALRLDVAGCLVRDPASR
jgi:hypothetical protein